MILGVAGLWSSSKVIFGLRRRLRLFRAASGEEALHVAVVQARSRSLSILSLSSHGFNVVAVCHFSYHAKRARIRTCDSNPPASKVIMVILIGIRFESLPRDSWIKCRFDSSSHGHVPLQCRRMLVSRLSVSPVLLDVLSGPSFQPAFTSGSCRQELQDQTTPFLRADSQVYGIRTYRDDKEARILPIKVSELFLCHSSCSSVHPMY